MCNPRRIATELRLHQVKKGLTINGHKHKNISSNEIKVKKINTYLSFHIIVLKTDRNQVINQNSLYL